MARKNDATFMDESGGMEKMSILRKGQRIKKNERSKLNRFVIPNSIEKW